MSEPSKPSAHEPTLPRRDFIILLGQAGLVIGLGGIAAYTTGGAELLRPPGAVAPRRFRSLCIKCDKCVQVCPTHAVARVLVTEDWVSAGTPRLSFRQGYCDLCLKCAGACPTGALQPVAKETVRIGVAQIVKADCVAWDWRGCDKCYATCQYDAISLDEDKRPVIDAQRCNGCGQCENVCPSTSLRAYTTNGHGKGIVVVPLSASL